MEITRIFKKRKTMLEREIDNLLVDMEEMYVDSEEYQASIEMLGRLHEMKSKDKSHVSPDTLAIVAGNLLGILLILKHEELNIITSKALNFVIRGRA